jgi:hypothetical protein
VELNIFKKIVLIIILKYLYQLEDHKVLVYGQEQEQEDMEKLCKINCLIIMYQDLTFKIYDFKVPLKNKLSFNS